MRIRGPRPVRMAQDFQVLRRQQFRESASPVTQTPYHAGRMAETHIEGHLQTLIRGLYSSPQSQRPRSVLISKNATMMAEARPTDSQDQQPEGGSQIFGGAHDFNLEKGKFVGGDSTVIKFKTTINNYGSGSQTQIRPTERGIPSPRPHSSVETRRSGYIHSSNLSLPSLNSVESPHQERTRFSSSSLPSAQNESSRRPRRSSISSIRPSSFPGRYPPPVTATLNPSMHRRSEAHSNIVQPSIDPAVSHAITQIMVGEFLYKYTRKVIGSGHTRTRNKRFFWVNPYTRTLCWSSKAPGSPNTPETRFKSVLIEGVLSISDSNPFPPNIWHRKSMVISTANRELKITAVSEESHEIWLSAMRYLLEYPGQVPFLNLDYASHEAANVQAPPISPSQPIPWPASESPQPAPLSFSTSTWRPYTPYFIGRNHRDKESNRDMSPLDSERYPEPDDDGDSVGVHSTCTFCHSPARPPPAGGSSGHVHHHRHEHRHLHTHAGRNGSTTSLGTWSRHDGKKRSTWSAPSKMRQTRSDSPVYTFRSR